MGSVSSVVRASNFFWRGSKCFRGGSNNFWRGPNFFGIGQNVFSGGQIVRKARLKQVRYFIVV